MESSDSVHKDVKVAIGRLRIGNQLRNTNLMGGIDRDQAKTIIALGSKARANGFFTLVTSP
jgi:hypothetical protein